MSAELAMLAEAAALTPRRKEKTGSEPEKTQSS